MWYSTTCCWAQHQLQVQSSCFRTVATEQQPCARPGALCADERPGVDATTCTTVCSVPAAVHPFVKACVDPVLTPLEPPAIEPAANKLELGASLHQHGDPVPLKGGTVCLNVSCVPLAAVWCGLVTGTCCDLVACSLFRRNEKTHYCWRSRFGWHILARLLGLRPLGNVGTAQQQSHCWWCLQVLVCRLA